jgi:hypothetical protein
LALLLLGVLGCGGWLWWSSQRGWTVSKLERLIRAELPPLCDRAAAEAWFNRHGIAFAWFHDTTGDVSGKKTMVQIAKLRSSQLSGMLRGDIEGSQANVDWIFPGRISVYLFFDKEGMLVGHLVHPFVYEL